MNTEKVTKEQAEIEINSWLDEKRIFKSTREETKREIDNLVDAVCEGYLSVDDKFILNQKLVFPEMTGNVCTTLKYKLRLSKHDMKEPMKGVKAEDGDGRVVAIISALTDEAKGVINKLDTQDYKIAQSIAVFFL